MNQQQDNQSSSSTINNNNNNNNNEHPSLAMCLNLLASEVDEEKFVGLILVKNIVKQDDQMTMTRVYNSLGLSFINRLLMTTPTNYEKEEQQDENISYHSLAVNILSIFISFESDAIDIKQSILFSITQSNHLQSILSSLLLNMNHYINQSKPNIEYIDSSIRFIYTILSFESKLMSLHSNTNQKDRYKLPMDQLINDTNINLLDKLIISFYNNVNQKQQQSDDNNNQKQDMNNDLFQSWLLVLQLYFYRVHERNEKNQFNQSGASILLPTLSRVFRDSSNDSIKYHILPIFILLFQMDSIPKHPQTRTIQHTQSLYLIADTLYHLFLSFIHHSKVNNNIKLSIKQQQQEMVIEKEEEKEKEEQEDEDTITRIDNAKDQSIILFSLLFDLYGGEWVMDNKRPSKNGEKLIHMACQTIRTEIHMTLLQHKLEDSISDDKFSVLLACYSIMEGVINYLVSLFEEVDEKSATMISSDMILNIRNILVDSNTIMLAYLKSVCDEMESVEPSPLVMVTIKRLGHFLAEEASSLSEELSLSLLPIIKYIMSHHKSHGHFLSFLLPGILNYIGDGGGNDEDDDEQSTKDNRSTFFKQLGHVQITQFLIHYLSTLITFIYEFESIQQQSNSNTIASTTDSIQINQQINQQTQANQSIYNSMISYDITVESVVGTIIPSSIQIINIYLQSINLGNHSSTSFETLQFQEYKSTFMSLFVALSDAMRLMNQYADSNRAIGDNYRDQQQIQCNLVLLSLSILSNMNESDFSVSTLFKQSLIQSCDCISSFYSSMEFPPSDQSQYQIWKTLSIEWLHGINLLTQCIDRYSIMSNSLTSKRWPPPDFTLTLDHHQQQHSMMDRDTINTVNTSISHLIRVIIRNSSSSQSSSTQSSSTTPPTNTPTTTIINNTTTNPTNNHEHQTNNNINNISNDTTNRTLSSIPPITTSPSTTNINPT